MHQPLPLPAWQTPPPTPRRATVRGAAGVLAARRRRRRCEKSECSVERAGFKSTDVDLYVRCQGCGERMSKECLESIAKALDLETFDESIHDPLGVWWSYKRRVWKKNEPTPNFIPSHGNEAASFVHCIVCEDMWSCLLLSTRFPRS
jgi:hypothetical protein